MLDINNIEYSIFVLCYNPNLLKLKKDNLFNYNTKYFEL